VRYERKQVETFSNKNANKDFTTNKHSRSTRKCEEESKKRQEEREITQIVSRKQVSRKGNFTCLKMFQAKIKTIGSDKNQISTQTTSQTKMKTLERASGKQAAKI
jgi:hypothetical protein